MANVYRWNGKHFGFIEGGNLLDAHRNRIADIKDDKVFRNRTHIGDVRRYGEQTYILRKKHVIRPNAGSMPKVTVPPSAYGSVVARAKIGGWEDALEDFVEE